MADAGNLEDDKQTDRSFNLIASDGKQFTVTVTQASISGLVNNALSSNANLAEIKVEGHSGAVLAKIVEYMVYHNGTESDIPEKPLRSKLMKDVCKDAFDAEFIDGLDANGLQRQLLYDVLLCADYMHIKALVQIGCAKVASIIKGQNVEKIKVP